MFMAFRRPLKIVVFSTLCPSLTFWHPAQSETPESRVPRRAVEQNNLREVGTLRDFDFDEGLLDPYDLTRARSPEIENAASSHVTDSKVQPALLTGTVVERGRVS